MAETLRDRCREIYGTMNRDSILRQHDPIDTLEAFVLSERGRAADDALTGAKPVILYFGSDEDRDEFMALVREAKPGLMTKALP